MTRRRPTSWRHYPKVGALGIAVLISDKGSSSASLGSTIKKGKQLSSESNLGASAGGTRLGAAETDSARYVRIVSNRFFAFHTKEVANVRRHNSHHWE
ncbi:GYF domain protein [Aspergillus luchuensis]|uniref:GYF domain protein n=1 Tax=Aspergillus kawachii TaxID=1069201 RepID=A0A146FCN8_ASPKA|nr:GYF domain protein [Aspergillus luchuensis]